MSHPHQEGYKVNGIVFWTMITAVATAIGAVATVGTLVLNFSPGSGTVDPPSLTTSAPSPEPSRPAVRIIEPAQGARVGYQAGTDVRGTASNLGGRSLVLFNVGSDPQGDRAYYTASDPLLVINGEWGVHVGPIGSPGDAQEAVTFIVAFADQNCETLIMELHAKPENEQYFQGDLPAGCAETAASVRVVKDHS